MKAKFRTLVTLSVTTLFIGTGIFAWTQIKKDREFSERLEALEYNQAYGNTATPEVPVEPTNMTVLEELSGDGRLAFSRLTEVHSKRPYLPIELINGNISVTFIEVEFAPPPSGDKEHFLVDIDKIIYEMRKIGFRTASLIEAFSVIDKTATDKVVILEPIEKGPNTESGTLVLSPQTAKSDPSGSIILRPFEEGKLRVRRNTSYITVAAVRRK